jgi:trehalose 2-sulfotransferase
MDIGDLRDLEFADAGDPVRSYLICSVPRSGSNLLCELLSDTGVAGAPTELLHPGNMRMLKRRWGVETMDEYLAQLLARKTGPNGVFGLKAQWAQYARALGDSDPRHVLPGLRLIHSKRRDHLRQAVSWVRAQQTLRFRSNSRVYAERTATFDTERITRVLKRIARLEEHWADLFDRLEITAHTVVYEDFVADRTGTLRDVLEFIGVEPPAGFQLGTPILERQADALSEQWVERYIAETGHGRV